MDKYATIGNAEVVTTVRTEDFKIELKKVKIIGSLSRETTCFSADLWINGKHAGYARNEGSGGMTFVDPKNDNGWTLIKMAEVHCENMSAKTLLHSVEVEGIEQGAFSIPMTLDTYIDDLVAKEDERQQMEKHFRKGIVVGVHGSDKFAIYKTPRALSSYGAAAVKEFAASIRAKLKDGEVILNTNIPA